MKDVSPEMFMTFLIVAAALIGFVLLIWQLIDRIKAASKPAREMSQWRSDTDKRLTASETQGKIMLKGLSALLSHEINGNSIDKLTKAQTEITNYLIDR